MSTIRTEHRTRSSGFTIVELLIVIVVIGVLAAIVIVAYNGVQNRAKESAAISNASQTTKKVLAYQATEGVYPTTLEDADILDTSKLQYSQVPTANPPTFCITATEGNASYFTSSTSMSPTKGGCPGHGVGGVAATTNLSPNPSVESNTTSWVATRGTGTRDTTKAFAGTASYRYDANGTAGGNYLPLTVQTGDISNKQIKASIRVQSSTSGLSMRNRMYFRDASNAIISNLDGGFITPTGSWNTASVSAVAPVGTTNIVIYTLFTTTLTAGTLVWFDGFMVTVGSETDTYADGNSTDWVWNGAMNNSTSTGP